MESYSKTRRQVCNKDKSGSFHLIPPYSTENVSWEINTDILKLNVVSMSNQRLLPSIYYIANIVTVLVVCMYMNPYQESIIIPPLQATGREVCGSEPPGKIDINHC